MPPPSKKTRHLGDIIIGVYPRKSISLIWLCVCQQAKIPVVTLTKKWHFRAPVASTVSPPSTLTFLYFQHHRSLLNRICVRSIEPYFSTINSRIQEVHLLCDAWILIANHFLPFPHQYCPVCWLPVSQWYPQKNWQKENIIRRNNWRKETTIIPPPSKKTRHLGEDRANALILKQKQTTSKRTKERSRDA